MSAFLTPLSIEAADDQDSGEWILTRALHYQSDLARMVIIVPKGFQTDLASVPRIPLIYTVVGNVATKAAVVHDYLYSSGMVSRKMADAILREASEVTGVSWFRRWTMWLGVRIGGGSHYIDEATNGKETAR